MLLSRFLNNSDDVQKSMQKEKTLLNFRTQQPKNVHRKELRENSLEADEEGNEICPIDNQKGSI